VMAAALPPEAPGFGSLNDAPMIPTGLGGRLDYICLFQ